MNIAKEIQITITIQELDLIGLALQKLPYEQSAATIHKLSDQYKQMVEKEMKKDTTKKE